LYGSLLAAGLLVFLLVPYFKAHLFNDEPSDIDDKAEIAADVTEVKPA
jgi:hypothetical protein